MVRWGALSMVRYSLETRWFFQQPPFELAGLPEGAISAERTDWYACPCHTGKGIKFREGNFETKLLVEDHGLQELAGTRALLQTWQKWIATLVREEPPSSSLLGATGWVSVTKRRHMWCYEVQDGATRQVRDRVMHGCEFEWTELDVLGQRWWTIALEAVGQADTVDANLRLVAERMFTGRVGVEQFTAERSMGYPTWLEIVTRKN